MITKTALILEHHEGISVLGPVSRKSRKLFGPEEPFVRLRSAYSVKLIFSYVVKRIKTKITAKFRASRRLRFEDAKRIMSPEMRPKSFGTFEKRAPGDFPRGHTPTYRDLPSMGCLVRIWTGPLAREWILSSTMCFRRW